MATCPNCGNQTGEGAIFCDQCGTRLSVPEEATLEAALAPAGGSVICPACGAGNVPGEAFCDFCGTPLDAPVPSAAVEPEPVPEPAEAEPPAAAEAEPVAEEAPAPGEPQAGPTCPVCGAEIQPDDIFCADCGASVAAAPLPPEPVEEVQVEPSVVEAVVEEAPPEAEPEVVVEAVVEEAPPEAEPEVVVEAVVEEAPPEAEPEVVAEPVLEETLITPPPSPTAPAGPRLIVSATGAVIPLSVSGEMLIGREDPVSGIYPDIDMTPHGGEEGGISRRHARLVLEGGRYGIEDLDSTNFTFVNKQKLASKTRHQLNDGDEIRCGRVAMVFRT